MSTSINDGGPAFPNIKRLTSAGAPDYSVVSGGGMTLRDYFAGQALPKAVEFGASPESTALRCYAIADAMIAARGGAK